MQKIQDMHFQVYKNLPEQCYALSLYIPQPDQKMGIAKNVEIEVFPPETCPPIAEPLLKIKYKDAQQLLDELWQAGLRPSDLKSSDGQIQAMQAHINDLRWLLKAHVAGASDD